MSDGNFMGWFDDTRGKTLAEKLAPALQWYQEKHGRPATLVLCNQADYAAIEGVEVRAVGHVRPNNFWVGVEDGL